MLIDLRLDLWEWEGGKTRSKILHKVEQTVRAVRCMSSESQNSEQLPTEISFLVLKVGACWERRDNMTSERAEAGSILMGLW